MLDGMRHFLAIVETGTFTEAARRVHLSQPALSASIRRLEDALGAPLLLRGRTGAEPTAAGHALIPRARAALGAVEEARRAVDRKSTRLNSSHLVISYAALCLQQ